jgi:hypothetical protein
VLEEFKGYFKLAAFDCQDEQVKVSQRFKSMCEKADHTPFFQLIKPAETKINPYTKQPMMPQAIPYNDNQVTLPKIKTYILSNLPDFSRHLGNLEKLEDFRNLEGDGDINRVILFSKKAKTPPIFKVLSAVFRERFRFGFVAAETAGEVVKAYQDSIGDTYPTILLLKSWDAKENKTSEAIEVIEYDKKEYKLDELKEFLNPHARWAKKETQRKDAKKEDGNEDDEGPSKADQKAARKKPYAEIYNDRHFNTHIGDNEKAALVFFTLGSNPSQEIPLFDKLTKMLLGPLQVGVFYLNESAPEF